MILNRLKLKYIVGLFYIALISFCSVSCIDRADMVDPPLPEDDPGALVGWFVKEDGNGVGTSWDDAMSPSTFLSRLPSISTGETVYMAAGTYYVGTTSSEYLLMNKSINIYGGFDPNSTGWDVEITYPSQYETIISGDLNGNGVADAGDSRLMEIAPSTTVNIKGVIFECGYVSGGTSHPGIHIKETGSVNLEYCKFRKNVSDSPNGSGNDAGGPSIYVKGGSAYCYKTEFVDNIANNRGGAIRLQELSGYTSRLVLEACVVANNLSKGDWGAAIQMSGDLCQLYLLNTTIANNHVGKGSAVNGNGTLVIVNTTIANNTADRGADGTQIRHESKDKCVIVNSIVTSNTGDSSNPDIIINGTDKTITSEGYNTIGVVGGSGKNNFQTKPSDQLGVKASAVFGTNVLADNGGNTMTIALNSDLRGILASDLPAFMNKYWNYPKYDLLVDQRGETRSTSNLSVGAYEY